MSLRLGVACQLERQFPISEAPNLWEWLNTPRSANFDDFAMDGYEEFKSELLYRVRTHHTWAVKFEDQVVGFIGALPSSGWTIELQGFVIAPDYRRRGFALMALRLLKRTLLHEMNFCKIIARPFADNAPMRAVLQQAGFVQEGYLTAVTKRDDKLIDMRIMCYPGVRGAEE